MMVYKYSIPQEDHREIIGQLRHTEKEREAEMQRLTEDLYARETHMRLLESEVNELREAAIAGGGLGEQVRRFMPCLQLYVFSFFRVYFLGFLFICF